MIYITDRQRKVLQVIFDYIVRYHMPPTLRELGAALGIKSTNGVNDHLCALERKGYITRRSMQSRAIAITAHGLKLVDHPTEAAGNSLVLRGTAILTKDDEDDSNKLSINITHQATAMLETLVQAGLFGDTVEQVVERLLYEKLRDVLRDVKR